MIQPEWPFRTRVEEVAVAGLQDWTSASFLLTLVAEGPTPPAEGDLGPSCLGVVAWMVLGGLAELGDVRDGFQPWLGTPAECVDRAVRSWIASGGPHDLGDLFWLRNTAAGHERGRAVLAREGVEPPASKG